MIDTFNGALTLNRSLLHSLRESPQVVRRGLLVVLLVGLLVGGINGARTTLALLDPEREFARDRSQIEASLEQIALAFPPGEVRQIFQQSFDQSLAQIAAGEAVARLPAPLPRPLGAIVSGVGVFLNTPLSYLGGLLIAVIFSHIAARWLGGQGHIQQMLGLGALSVAPHALDALGFIPVLGFTLGLIAWFWGLVVLVIATSVAHRLDAGKATLAVLLFPLIGGVLFLLGCCALLLVTIIAARGG